MATSSKIKSENERREFHVATDTNVMFKEMVITPTDADIKQIERLTRDKKKYIFTDGVYISKEHNKKFVKVQAVAELSFAFIKHFTDYTSIRARFIGLEQMVNAMFLLVATYNLRRTLNLQRKI